MNKNTVEHALSNNPATGKGYVYVLEDKTSGKIYVGQTTRKLSRRLHEHNSPNKLTVKRAIEHMKHGAANFKVKDFVECDIENIDEAEGDLIAKNNAIEEGMNTNHAPKVNNRNHVSRLLKQYAKWNHRGEYREYNMSEIYEWAKNIVANNALQCSEEEFRKGFSTFIKGATAVNNSRETSIFKISAGGGEGTYKKVCPATAAKRLKDGEDVENMKILTKRIFFFNKADAAILKEKDKLSDMIENIIEEKTGTSYAEAMSKAKNPAYAKALNEAVGKEFEQKKKLEARLRTKTL